VNYAALWLLTTGSLLACLPCAAADIPQPLSLQRRMQWLDPAAAKRSTDDNQALIRAQFPQIPDAALQRAQSTGRSRVTQYPQQVHGIEVYGARLSVLRDADGQPRVVGGSLSAQAKTAALPAFALDAGQALAKVLAALKIDAVAGAAKRGNAEDRYLRLDLLQARGFSAHKPARIKPVWYPAGERLIAAYYVEVLGTRKGEQRPLAEAVLVSAEDGRILRRQSQIHDLQPFDYRVFAGATSGYPYFDPYGYTNPHPTSTPNGYKPTVPATMPLLSRIHGGISTGDPWLADDATQTRGNNVDAFFNADDIVDGDCGVDGWGPQFIAENGDFRANVTGTRRFDYPYDVNQAPADYVQCFDPLAPIPTDDVQLNAKIVQGFYAGNWLHDRFYDAGYDEAAGNSQQDNYGRGGLDNDPLIVHAGYLSTFTYAPADGESPSLTLGINLRSRSNRDVSAFDLGVTAHEWSHTMFGRLTTSSYYGQPAALNEGTADFVGLIVMVREQDRHARAGAPDFSAAYAVGAYMNSDYDYSADDLPPAGTPGNPDNTYYHGIRRYPYSSDKTINPLTFRHISLDNPVPAGSNPYDWKSRSLSNAEIHTAGEVWTNALWHCARNIFAAAPGAQFQARHNQFLQWLVSGHQLFPTDATYTEARDAMLAAIRTDSEADYRRCRSAFAARGLGAGAISPPRDSYSLRGVVESYRDVSYALDVVSMNLIEGAGGDGDGVLDRNESGTLRISLRNTGFETLDDITVAAPPIPGFYDISGALSVNDIHLAPGELADIDFAIRVRSPFGNSSVPIQTFAWDQDHPQAFAAQSRSFAVSYNLVRDRYVDTLDHAATFSADWTPMYLDYPHGCAQYICMGPYDDPVDDADVLPWKRQRYNGNWAYLMGDPQLSLNAALASQAFTVSASAPLELKLRHDFDFERAPTGPSAGRVEIRIDGGDWLYAAPFLASGQAEFRGLSSGWRNDTLRFNASLAGRSVQLRFLAQSNSTFRPNDAHWALSRIEISGATTAPFSRAVADLD
jgi:Fungalysin metallopeptidase (M36)